MRAVTEEILKQALLARRLTHEKAMGSCCIQINYEELLSELFPDTPKFGELILVWIDGQIIRLKIGSALKNSMEMDRL
jgi:hypothetical protein